ncbi:hypothetical protein [Agromyces sp. CCNWLW203]|uniref:hypothetical protein n=1 Tax=Agromyces sp. CCNWLW203 TaxID=3112842 RepID=UPI002F9618F0
MDCETYPLSCKLDEIASVLDSAPSTWEVVSQILITVGAVGAAVFALWALVQKRAYQARPIWVPLDVAFADPKHPVAGEDLHNVAVRIANHGDGAALNVQGYLTLNGERRAVRKLHFAAIEPGGHVEFRRGRLRLLSSASDERVQRYWSGEASQFDFEGAIAHIEYSMLPNRRKRLVADFPLDDVQKLTNAEYDESLAW